WNSRTAAFHLRTSQWTNNRKSAVKGRSGKTKSWRFTRRLMQYCSGISVLEFSEFGSTALITVGIPSLFADAKAEIRGMDMRLYALPVLHHKLILNRACNQGI